MKHMSHQDVLEGIRSGQYVNWDKDEFRSELCRSERIDSVRPLVRTDDLPLVLRLVGSNDEDDVLMAHVLGRKFMRETPAQVGPAFSVAYERWRAAGNLFLAVSLFHDLAEQPEFLQAHRQSFVDLVEERPAGVKAVIATFVGDDAGFLRVFSHRLDDVFSDDPQTLNCVGKAFMYVLYLGLVDPPPLRAEAAKALIKHEADGDPFFQELTRTTLSRLRGSNE